MPLWKQHWQETERYREGQGFNPNVEGYIKYNDSDFYILYTARHNGKLVGNFGAYVYASMHTQKLEATEDTLFFLPEYRKGLNSVRFIKFVEKDLIERGVVEMSISVKSPRVGKFCEFIGYKLVAYQYSKVVEEKSNVRIKTTAAA